MDKHKHIVHLGTKLALSAALGVAVLLGLATVGIISYNQQSLHTSLLEEAAHRLDVLGTVHVQSMLARASTTDADPAMQILDQTFDRLSAKLQDAEVWLAMGPKVLAYQERVGGLLEPAQDEIDRAAMSTGQTVTRFSNDHQFRMSRPVVMGTAPADHEQCPVCHSRLMDIRTGEVLGTYSISIDARDRWLAMKQTNGDVIAAAFAIAVLLSLAAWIIMGYLAGRPVARMTGLMTRLADGDLAFDIPDLARNDEVGELAKALAVFRDNVAARKTAESQLKLMFAAVEQSASIIVITDVTGRILYVNSAFVDVVGYRSEEAIGQPTSILNAGKTRPGTYREMWNTILGGEVWRGELENRKSDGSTYWAALSVSPIRDQTGEICNFVAVSQDITEAKRAEAKIEYLAYHDVLTALPNRSLFRDRLDRALIQARRQMSQLALVLFDLDDFKAVNENYSHDVGDELIAAVAERLREQTRDADTLSRYDASLARYGDDEFTGMLVNVDGVEGASIAVQRLLACFDTAFQIHDQEIKVSASAGVSLYPRDGDDLQTLIKRADLALYHAKRGNRGSARFFEQSMANVVGQRRNIELDIEVALDEGQFWLAYQPQIDVRSGTVCGFEALLRWRHPQQGLIAPGVFIPVAETTRQIIRIGYWLLHETCRQIDYWRSEGVEPVPVAVNLSPVQMEDPGLVACIDEVMHKFGVPSELLVLELTEGTFMRSSSGLAATIQEIVSRGIRFALDDFGTGFSSLSYLTRFPIYKLKVDRSFVRNLHREARNSAIIRSVVTLGHDLDIRINAEGAELPDETELLFALGVDEIQGFFYSKPLEPGDAAQYLLGMTKKSKRLHTA